VNLAVQAALLIAILCVCCFAPGFFFIRRLRLTPLEKVCASVGLSIIILYFDAFIVFVGGGPGTGARMSAAPFIVSSILSLVAVITVQQDLFRLVRSFRVKRVLFGYGFLLIWTAAILAMIRVYSGAHWSGDWQEHFHRTLFFLQRLPIDTVFGDVYSLPARPPMMNVVASFFLAQTQDRFELFQIIYSFLNLLTFLPSCLLLLYIAGARRGRTLPLVMLFALSPVFIQNSTYSWSRGLTAFYVLLGLALYLSGWRKDDHLRMVGAFVALSAGLLVHYSAGPYVVAIAGHYLVSVFFKRPKKWKELTAIVLTCGVLLGSWFVWAGVEYGKDAFISNSTITKTQEYQGSNVAKIAVNFVDSIILPFFRNPAEMDQFKQTPSAIGRLRDYVFLFYQPNLVFGMGAVGGPIILWLMWALLRRKFGWRKQEKAFWVAFLLSATVLGCVVVGTREPLGLGHGTFLSLELLGLTLLATRISRRDILTTVVLAGCILDFSLGILLNAHVQSFENGNGKNYFSELVFSGSVRHADPGPDTLSEVAWQNWFEKHQRALCDRWLTDLPERYKNESFFKMVWPASEGELHSLRSQDELRWGGWYSRHNGQITYLGDHVVGQVGEWGPITVLTALLAGLIVVFIKQKPIVADADLGKLARPTRGRRTGKTAKNRPNRR
jgi:hypothetical protein